MQSNRQYHRGMTLIEVLAYVAIFSLATVLGSKLLLSSSRLYQVQTGFIDQSRNTTQLNEWVRDAIMYAGEVVAAESNDQQLVLRGLGSDGLVRHTILKLEGVPRHLSLVTSAEQGALFIVESVRASRLPLDSGEFAVEWGGSGRTLVRFNYTVHTGAPAGSDVPRHEVVAALQGANPVSFLEEYTHE
ncbi:MAG: prepilin-type N-terminal cleavage/methylation domain-containing protein [Candidatus Hydrogenedentes bacterium]|nr:prepilin-type N-terminal cleavage/methylation domain-containing protein [Candidatus Hydrogenedentota bacterium]